MGSWSARRISLLVLLAATLYVGYLVVRPFAGALMTGALFAIVFLPIHQRIERRFPGPTTAPLLSTALLLLLILLPLGLLAVMVSDELHQAYDAARAVAANGGASRLLDKLNVPVDAIAERFGMTGTALNDLIHAKVAQVGTVVLGGALSVVGSVPTGVIKFIITLLALFFFLRDGRQFHTLILRWSPLGADRTAELLRTIQVAIVASVNGVVAVAIAQGILCGIGIWIAGLPSPALWGVAAAAVSLIPVVGTALVWIPAAIILFAQGSWSMGLFMLLWGALPVSQADNVVRPLVLTAQLPVNALVLLIAMLGGASAFGIAGILLGPVLVAVTINLFKFIADEFESHPV